MTFALKAGSATDWTVLGTDDNPPYRVFYDVTGLAAGTPLLIKAIARDRSGNLDSDTGTAVVGEVEKPHPGVARDYAVVHYQRPDGEYAGWGLHVWGDVNEPDVTWPNPKPFAGEDAYGRFAWVKLSANASQVGFIVHNGDTKDPDGDRFFNPQQTPEIWLKSGDATVYASRAAAQGYVELRYHRPDGNYTGWGLHLWGDAIDPSEATEWPSPKLPDRIDDYGAHWRVRIQDATKPVNFIVHKGDEKDTAEDRSFLPTEKPSVWLQSGDSAVHATRGDAEDFVLIHYHRDDGDYGDPTSSNFNDFWGLHVWDGSAESGITWQNPVREIGRDGFGQIFKVRLVDGAPAARVHRPPRRQQGPGPDQFLDLNTFGHEVWILSGHVDADHNQKYLLPMLGGAGIDANLSKAKAHWLTRDTLVWNAEPVRRRPVLPELLADRRARRWRGGRDRRRVDPAVPRARALRRAEGEVAAPRGVQRVPIKPEDLDRVPEALRGQLAVSAIDENGFLRAATGVQIPGVLDDLYANDADLGATFAGRTPTLRLWAPTAQDVKLRLYSGGDVDGRADDARRRHRRLERDRHERLVRQGVPVPGQGVRADDRAGRDEPRHRPVLRRADDELGAQPDRRPGRPGAHADRLEATLRKPPLRAPEDIAIYELHIRDFSINDPTVPAAERGTYLAFTETNSDGMQHLKDARAGGAHARAPAARVRLRHHRRGSRQPPAARLRPRRRSRPPRRSSRRA